MTITALILRTIGIFFRIYMSNKIGAEGMGLYQLIFSIYVLAATFASSGICTAVTRMVTDELATGTKKSVLRILRRAVVLSALIGLLSAALVFFGADFIGNVWLKDARAIPALKILTPSLPFMGITSCLRGYFIEMSACEGSCIGGPVMHRYHSAPVTCKTRVEQYSGKSGRDFDDQPADDLRKSMQYIGSGAVKPGEAAIQEVLHKLGKYRPEDELNCGTCGYSTCREKAIAVCQGKADLTMCLPFLKARAESFSGAILDNTPNAIMAMDTKLIIQQANESAARLFGMESPREMVGMPIDAILGTVEYLQAIDGERPDGPIRHYLPEYDKYVEETIAFDPEYNLVISIIKDITDETRREQELDKERRRTAELADRVIEKQMRVAQEIASLLGETTAETKIALTRLKDTIEPGGEVKR